MFRGKRPRCQRDAKGRLVVTGRTIEGTGAVLSEKSRLLGKQSHCKYLRVCRARWGIKCVLQAPGEGPEQWGEGWGQSSARWEPCEEQGCVEPSGFSVGEWTLPGDRALLGLLLFLCSAYLCALQDNSATPSPGLPAQSPRHLLQNYRWTASLDNWLSALRSNPFLPELLLLGRCLTQLRLAHGWFPNRSTEPRGSNGRILGIYKNTIQISFWKCVSYSFWN